MHQNRCRLSSLLLLLLLSAAVAHSRENRSAAAEAAEKVLRFGKREGEFKIVQVADMHYANGRDTGCLDVFPNQRPTCSDLNTTAFIYRVIRDENPDLVVFTGDNIFGADSHNPAKSMDMAFAPAVALKLPWAAVLGNHDQEGYLSREGVMQHVVGMAHTLSRFNPTGIEIDGFGNYN